jgi:LacI family transcriptional regulator
MNRPKVNINDVADAAGVSRATVSQVLRETGRISAETRLHVLGVMQKLGYVYNRAAANLRAGSSRTIGIAITDLKNPFFAEFTSGATNVLEAAGYLSLLVDIHDDRARQQRFVTMLSENMVAGALLVPATGTKPRDVAAWLPGLPPTVALLRRSAVGALDFVGVDNRTGMAEATGHLLGLGHRAIGYVGGLAGSQSRADRRLGWRDALEEAGIAAPETWEEPCEATFAAGSAAIARLLLRVPELTAVVCHQDVVAYGVSIGLRTLGLMPGRDLSVMGFDDLESARDWDPPLSTMSVTPAALGAEAARQLLQRIADPSASLRTTILRPRVIARASTAPPRKVTRP